MAEANKINQILENIDVEGDTNQQYLTFELGNEHYGVDILRVQEIKGWEQVTEIPKSPGYMCGVLNLRGVIVPVVDLRLFFDMPFMEYSSTTVMVVLKVMHEAGQRIVGIVVDAVSDVKDIAQDNIKDAPDFGSVVCTDYIKGITNSDDNMLMLLDIDKLLSTSQFG